MILLVLMSVPPEKVLCHGCCNLAPCNRFQLQSFFHDLTISTKKCLGALMCFRIFHVISYILGKGPLRSWLVHSGRPLTSLISVRKQFQRLSTLLVVLRLDEVCVFSRSVPYTENAWVVILDVFEVSSMHGCPSFDLVLREFSDWQSHLLHLELNGGTGKHREECLRSGSFSQIHLHGKTLQDVRW